MHLGRQLDFFIFGKMLSKSIFFQVKLMDVYIHKKQMSLNPMKYYVHGLGSRVTWVMTRGPNCCLGKQSEHFVRVYNNAPFNKRFLLPIQYMDINNINIKKYQYKHF